MINTTDDRHLFIGGSEANMIYMHYETESFKSWWKSKLEGFEPESFSNLHMAVGTILEHDTLDLYEQINNVKGIRDDQRIKGIARANTDYILDNKVSDVKVSKKALQWHTKGKVPIQYKRQLIHYCYVYGLNKASVIAYQCDEELLNNPFQELKQENLFEIEIEITDENIQTHKTKIEYLEHCRDMGIYPK